MHIRLRRRRSARIRLFKGRPLTRGRRTLIVVGVILLLGALFVAVSAARARPIVELLAQSEAREFVKKAIGEAVSEEMKSGGLRYENLVTFEKNKEGNITALVTNTVLVNVLQTKIAKGVRENVINVIDTNMKIPLGSVTGGVLLSGRGPGIPVRIQSITNVKSEFINEFSAAGINQTLHKISLCITADIDIIVPGNYFKTDVTTTVAVAETIIVGSVPNVYANVGD